MNTVVSLLLLIVCSSFKNTSDYAIAYYLLSNISHICDVSRSNVCENAKGVRKHEDYMSKYFISQYGAIKDIDFTPIFEEILCDEKEG